MPEINFPAINGTDGSSCDVYSFGFTSECTNADGTNRGFTQDWFFDGTIGAWVSVTVGTTGGGGAIIDGFTYDTETHSAPPMEGTGQLRLIAFLDPVTGGLTFDYIRTYDVVSPNEENYVVQSFSWSGYVGYLTGNELENNDRSLTVGVTLCGDENYRYVFGSLTDTDTAWKWYINRESGNNASPPSPFAPPPADDADDFLCTYNDDINILTIDSPPGVDSSRIVPFSGGTYAFEQYNSGNSGEVLLGNGAAGGTRSLGPIVGFTTAGGPIIESFVPVLQARKVPGQGGADTDYNTFSGRKIRHENWLYFASVLSNSVFAGGAATPQEALDIVVANNCSALKAKRQNITSNTALYGRRVLLDPLSGTNGAVNGDIETEGGTLLKRKLGYDVFKYELNSDDFGPNVLNTTQFYSIVAIPTRALPTWVSSSSYTEARDKFIAGLYQIGTSNTANGFVLTNVRTGVQITNERNYEEEYTIFCSSVGSGIGPSTPEFKLVFNYAT